MQHSDEEIINKAVDQLASDPALIQHREHTTQKVMLTYKDEYDRIHRYTYHVLFDRVRKNGKYEWVFNDITTFNVH